MSTAIRIRMLVSRSVGGAGWAPMLVFVTHAVVSQTATYSRFPWLDIPMHLVGGMAIAFFFARVLACATEAGFVGAPNRLLLAVLVFTATATVAVFWELAEWSLDLYFEEPETLGLRDTLLDMVNGMIGATCYLALALSRRTLNASSR